MILLHGFVRRGSGHQTTISHLQRSVSRSGNMAKSRPHTGSRFDDFLKDEGNFDEVQARALKRGPDGATRREHAGREADQARDGVAKKMATSRSQLDRVLDPENVSVQFDTLIK